MSYTPAVTNSFLTSCRACTPNGTGLVRERLIYYPTVFDGVWVLETGGTGYTITAAVAGTFTGAEANADGSYTTGGTTLVLVVSGAACVDELPNPPPPH